MNMIKFLKIFNPNTLRKKLLIYSIFIILIMLITSIYTFYNTNQFVEKMDEMFVSNRQLKELSSNVDNIDRELLNYLTTKSTESYDNYESYEIVLKKNIEKMSKSNIYSKNRMMINNMLNIINNYLDEGEHALNARRIGDIAAYSSSYKRTQVISGYIKYYIDKLNSSQFQDNTNKYFYMSNELKVLKKLNLAIIIVTILLNVLLIFWFTKMISVPIVNLASAAEEISNGNLDVKDVKVNTDDEIKVMADTFNKMKNNIREYIKQLHEQAQIESRLMDEKMKNLKMKNLLKNAELQALQAQINPHFLFNTLNAGVQLAMMEDAEKTGILLEKISSFFRYNLKKVNSIVTLRDEINNLNTYIYILKTRFGDMIKFEIDIQEQLFDIKMPVMIIQPLVENACIHGIGNMEQGGVIKVKALKDGELAMIEVEDNGVGMDEVTVNNILNMSKYINEDAKALKINKTNGIGLKNVIERMIIFSGREDAVEIKSSVGMGTIVILKIPLKRSDNDV